MNKRVFTIMIALLLAAFVPKAWGQGAGTEETPIEISSYDELKYIDFSQYYKLTADITVDSSWDCTGSFTGTLDGNGHVIKGLSVSVTGSNNAGLFAEIGENGTVKNLGVIGSITSNCTSQYAGNNAGGIAGKNYGTIQNCYTNVTVTCNPSNDMCQAGGIAGYNLGTIQDCYTTGAVTCEKGYAGGIAGSNANNDAATTIQYCYATGAIKGNQAGGITGNTSIGGSILNCIALNDSINGKGNAPKVGRITGYRENYVTTLTANHAALSIPGAWTGKGANTENGDDLPPTFDIDGAGKGAFTGWNTTTSNWNFSDLTKLPQVNTDGGASINGQPTAKLRAGYLLAPVTTITKQEELAAIKDNLSGSYKLGNDITLEGDWTPLGEFTGTLDGCGFVISGLKVSVSVRAGLFGYIGKDGTVKNLGVTGTTVTATSAYSGGYAGGIAGYSEGTIQNCYTSVAVTAASSTDGAGGIVGNNDGTIKNCYTTGAVTNEKGFAGGIAGKNTKDIQYCYATGIIKGSKAGGITGENSLNTKYCIALNASITGTTSAGRIAGGTSTGFFFTTNYAALSISGAWEDKGDKKMDGTDLTATSFTAAIATAFTGWNEADWDFSITANLPILMGFKTADQPVKDVARAPFLEVPVTTITKQEELAAIKSNLAGSYKLGGNITLSGDWTPIAGEFKGTLDGGGFVISGLKVSATDNNAGLFETIGTGGIVKNLGITDGSVTATYACAGSIAGQNFGTIQNCYTNVAVTSTDPASDAGGITGINKGIIQNCYTTGAVTSKNNTGGIAGSNLKAGTGAPTSTIQYCYATGTIRGGKAGGIAGYLAQSSTIQYSIALNDSIESKGTAPVGRIIGSEENGGGTLAGNHAALSIPGAWAADDKAIDKKNGADLTEDTFTGKGVNAGAFIGWTAANWDFSSTPDLPFLKGFKTDQPVKDKKRAPFLEVPVTTITNKAGLAAIKDNLAGSYKLGNDIDLKDVNWAPIAGEFTGTLDGCGYVIRNLTIKIEVGFENTGLFHTIGKKGTVKNFGVTGNITARGKTGGIAGYNYGIIQNCYTNVKVTSLSSAGGIAGVNYRIIQNSYTTGAVTSDEEAGGIAGVNMGGDNTATIQYSYATGAIKGYQAGGITGKISTENTAVTNCIALNDSIIGTGDAPQVGRIAGVNMDSGTLYENHAALSIPGAWAADDKAIDKKNGADLPETFGTDVADTGVFAGWKATDWDITTIYIPTLQGFKTADQPVNKMKRAPFLVVPVTTITNQAGLVAIKENLSGSYKLGGNITLSGNWTPIADKFTGTLDGCGYTISNLTVNVTGNNNAGLFGYIGKDGTVKNLGVTGSVTLTDATSSVYAGGIAGESYGKITNCYTNVTVSVTGTGFTYAGGIVGVINGVTAAISNCFTTGDCTANSSLTAIAGGIVGDASPGRERHISYCFATGTVKAEGSAARKLAGGIAGQKGGTITGCIALNKGITGAKGLTNRIAVNSSNGCTIADCYASPAIDGTWSYIGATDLDGADLTSTNFINSNDAFTGWVPKDWRLGDNWQFEDKDFANLPTLLTNGLIPEDIVLAGQTAIKRADCLGLVLIDKAVTYDANLHKDKNLVIAPTGNLTVNTANAQVSSLEIQPGGQVTTTAALGVTKAISTSRTLENQWSTFGAPVAMTFKAIEKAYKLEGYASSEAAEQQWTRFNLPSSGVSLPAVSPNLLAIDKGSETVSFSSDNGTLIPVVAKAESGTTLSNGIFLFRTNPSLSNQTVTNAYILSDDGTRFELQDTAYTLKPFECYVIANAATTKAVQSLRVANGIPTGNDPITLPSDAFRLWGADGQLHLEASQPTDVQVYTLTGTLTHSFRLDGSRTLTLPRGIYLVRSNNITYKVSL